MSVTDTERSSTGIGPLTSLEQDKAVVRRLFEELYARRNVEVLDEVAAPEFRAGFLGRPSTVCKRGRTTTVLRPAAFPDLACSIDDLVGEGDQVAVRGRLTGTHLAAYGSLGADGQAGRSPRAYASVAGRRPHRQQLGRLGCRRSAAPGRRATRPEAAERDHGGVERAQRRGALCNQRPNGVLANGDGLALRCVGCVQAVPEAARRCRTRRRPASDAGRPAFGARALYVFVRVVATQCGSGCCEVGGRGVDCFTLG